MADGARLHEEDDAFVLLLSDRPAERQVLARAIDLALGCRPLAPGEPLPTCPARLAVIDLDAAALAETAPLLDRGAWHAVPRLVLARIGCRPIRLPPGSRVLPAAATRETVLATAFAMIEAAAGDVRARGRRLHARAAAATALVADLFDSAALGARIDPAAVEQGTEIVVETVAEAGIRTWLDVVWRHDAGVYQHTLGVAGFAAAFGASMRLGAADHRRFARAALLHDIGKSRIPGEILNKPGRLSPEEWRLMQRHPVIGADLLLAQGDTDPPVVEVVRHHHERLDGAGYPDGLAGTEISDLVRLTAICDVFSALTERRSYRAPLDPRQALESMEADRGHLDPLLLRAFAAVAIQG